MCSSFTPSPHGSRSTLMAACSSAEAISTSNWTDRLNDDSRCRASNPECALRPKCVESLIASSAGVLPMCFVQLKALMYMKDSSVSDASVAFLRFAAAISSTCCLQSMFPKMCTQEHRPGKHPYL